MKSQWRIALGMKTIFAILSWLLSLFLNRLHQPLQAQEFFPPYEILLTNETSSSLFVKVEPVGMIFNDREEYSLVATGVISGTQGDLITGNEVTIPAISEKKGVANHALTSIPPGVNRHICYGRYRMSINGIIFYVDFSDYDYPEAYVGNPSADLFFAVDASGRVLWVSISYPAGNVVELDGGEIIKVWDQTLIGGGSKPQNKNGFKILANTTMPLNGSDDTVSHINPGKLYVNATVQGNVTVINDISVENGAALTVNVPGTQVKFNSGKKLTINGKLIADSNNPNQRITFTRNGASGNWGGIQINSGSSSNASPIFR